MARQFDSRDAKRLITKHRELLEELRRAEKTFNGLRAAVKETTDALVAQEVMRVLKDIPVEELNRARRGFRVKSLRDNGYQSIADIMGASVHSLASISGISDEAAYSIKKTAEKIVSATRQSVKIKLSEDNKTPAATQAVLAISKYRSGGQYGAEVKKLIKNYGREIEYAIEDLQTAAGGLKWMFSSKLKKQKAIDAYESLSELLQGAYFSRYSRRLKMLRRKQVLRRGRIFRKIPFAFSTRWRISIRAFSARMTRFTVCRKSWREKYRNRAFSRTVFCANCVAIRNGA